MIKCRRLRWTDNVARMEDRRSAFKIITGKAAGKTPLGRPRRRWEDNINKEEENMLPSPIFLLFTVRRQLTE